MITSAATFGSSRPQFAIVVMRPVKEYDCMSVSAPLKDKRVDTLPLRYAESVAVTCPDFIGSAAEPGCPAVSWS